MSAVLARSLNCPRTSSMGRLFDAVAALCGFWQEMTFEGQAAMKLEFAAEEESTESYSLPFRATEGGLIADWEPMIRQILAERLAGEPAGRISARFHNALAGLALDLARAVGCNQVVLTGGCFQNALLTRRVRQHLVEGGFAVYTHQRVPPGDGGIALGQVFVAARQVQGLIDVLGNMPSPDYSWVGGARKLLCNGALREPPQNRLPRSHEGLTSCVTHHIHGGSLHAPYRW